MILSKDKSILTNTWFLTAGETDARSLMPITLMAARAIETATEHANALGIGYTELAEHRLGWVLARLSIEVLRYPGINETYSMSTWIEGYNRFFSDRCYEMTDASGNTIANIRSMWVAIDMKTRTMADLAELERERFPISERRSPVSKERAPLIAKGAEVSTRDYTFKYCDIDFNRHVNTIRYLELVLNTYSLDFFDKNDIRRLDVSFEHECHFGDTVTLKTGAAAMPANAMVTEIHTHQPQQRAVSVKLTFSKRAQQAATE
ncbi:MAG: hypothetical protein K1V80_04420 [Muribaculaceae bacterium]